jgi:hypothetical protein
MKKTLIGTCAMLGLVASSFGQGQVYIANTSASATHIQTNNVLNNPGSSTAVGTGRLVAGQPNTFLFALFSANNSVDDVMLDPITHLGTPWMDPRWAFTDNYGTNTGTLGRMATATWGNTNGAAVVQGYDVATTASLMLVGWQRSVGGDSLATFLNAYNSGLVVLAGYSDVAHILMGNGGTTPNSLMFGAAAGLIQGFTLSPVQVPEPTTFALAGLGAAALLIFRRRR